MKKILLTYLIIIVAVFLVLSLVCRDKEYAAEKLFYKVNKLYNKIKVNPDVAPPRLFTSIENYLQKILKKYPETDIARISHIALAEVYITNNKYDDAVKILDTFTSGEEKNVLLISKAYFLKGTAYEKQGKWDKALKEFTILKNKYSNTSIGLQTPLYIAQYYMRKNKNAEAQRAYSDAITHYKKLIIDKKGTLIGYVSSNLLTQAYMELNRYEDAGKVVEETIKTYPVNLTVPQNLPMVELIFVKTLRKPEKAIEIYKTVMDSTSNARLKQILQSKIKQLETK